MKYLLLSVLVIFIIGFFVVEDAFGIQYARVNIQPNTDTTDCGDDNSCYSPHTITIKQFEWVKWKNLDTTIHTITAGYPHDPHGNVYDSGAMASGSTFEYQFHQKGKYPYFCQIHPWAQGFVIVTEGTSSAPPPTPPAQTSEGVTIQRQTPTILILDPLPSRASSGDTLTLSGILKTADGKQVVTGATIEIYAVLILDGETKPVSTPLMLKTDNNGKFSAQFPVPEYGEALANKLVIDWRAVYEGARNLESSVSQTHRILFTSTTTSTSTSTTTSTSTLPPGVKPSYEVECNQWLSKSKICYSSNFEDGANGLSIEKLYKDIGYPQKKYAFTQHGYSIKNAKIVSGDGRELLVFDLHFKNSGDDREFLGNDDFAIFDGKDREFRPSISSISFPNFQTGEIVQRENPDFNWREDCPAMRDVSINPGLTGKVKLCFEIPKDADHFKVIEYYPTWRTPFVGTFDRASFGIGSSGSGNTERSSGGGCLIATAAFGSEMAPQVQFLREIRDNTVLQTESGTSFMTGFNQFYYSFSPAIADYERENPAFKEAVKITLTPLLTSLTLLQYADIDSESEMLGYGIGVILLNIGMYFVAPAVLLSVCIRKIHQKQG